MSEVVQPRDAADDLDDIDGRGLSHEDRLTAIEQRLCRGARRIVRLEANVAENTQLTREIRELLEFGRSGLRLLGHVGAAMRWLRGIAAALLALWALWQAVRNGAPADSGNVLDAVVQAYRDGAKQ